ncbi:MAG: phage head-tail adapter protein [Ruminococcus sp.]|uniref:phage head-tail adapter protein n=1 Tax=Ruminococcus sp. TaxID=41978 RepID=UPI001B2CA3FE|nr:phage head-tail adapter protein [Ruminococcus sp.]MBO7472566.1 phage head-tail adapter protein [Ruminococcus sp.]
MNKEWSELNKKMQSELKKNETYKSGIDTLLELRGQLMKVLYSFKNELSRKEFDAMPFLNAKGYHNKNIAYSLWHIFRIEDIVAHTLINNDEQVFFDGKYMERINSSIITTGNELVKGQIEIFSQQLNIDALYAYISEVKESTEKILNALPYDMLKTRISPEREEKIASLNVVSDDENASWLIDYWCGKDIRGLIQMPFSRHWIMHIEACLRIRDKLAK